MPRIDCQLSGNKAITDSLFAARCEKVTDIRMDVDIALGEDLNTNREKVNGYEQIFNRLLKYRGVLSVTVLVKGKVYQSSIPMEKAEPIAEKWMSVYYRADRDIRNMDPEDTILTLQVSTKNHELVMAFGQYQDNCRKTFAIMVHQHGPESVLPKELKDKSDSRPSKLQDKPGDPREMIQNFNCILELRRKIWKDQPELLLPKNDPQLFERTRSREMEYLKELQNTPKFRGYRRHGRELEIFYHFLSRCKVGPPDPATGKCKWTWIGKPVVENFGPPNRLTMEMAREFSEAHEEVEKAIDDIGDIIEDKNLLEDAQRDTLKKRIEKQKIKILLRKMEELRRKRLDRRWRQRCYKKRY